MIIRTLEFVNFRNHAHTRVDLSPTLNFFVGKNAQGKTNLLEAIYMTCVGRGFRAVRDRELVRFGGDHARVKTTAEKKYGKIDVEIQISTAERNAGKQIKINGIPIAKMGELMGTVTCVFFCPDELRLIKDAPADRRRFMDIDISQLDKTYFYNLLRYARILRQRNALLKTIGQSADEMRALDIWDAELCKIAEPLMRRRVQFINDLKSAAAEIHKKLAPDEILEISLESNFDVTALQRARANDIRLRTTTVGIHRDDILIQINGRDARTYASQGQQRTIALSMKLAELQLFERQTNERPILLLDDVFSELDSTRQKKLLELISGTQTIITGTVAPTTSSAKIFHIQNGSIIK